MTPRRTLRGIEEIREKLSWGSSSGPEHLDVESEGGELEDVGGGKIVRDLHQTYRWKETGEFAYERHVRFALTLRDGKIARYEMTIDEG